MSNRSIYHSNILTTVFFLGNTSSSSRFSVTTDRNSSYSDDYHSDLPNGCHQYRPRDGVQGAEHDVFRFGADPAELPAAEFVIQFL